jgi:hypothetical protein
VQLTLVHKAPLAHKAKKGQLAPQAHKVLLAQQLIQAQLALQV